MSRSSWGEGETQFFYDLTPEDVLSSVEASGLELNGRCIALNSFENRVYELELDFDDPPKDASERISRRRVAKFYRPGRWSKEQILEEHEFLLDLVKEEIPAVPPIVFPNGETLHRMEKGGLYYAVFPKVGGRSPDELDDEQRHQIGRLLARIHNVGSTRDAKHRIQISPASYGIVNLEFLIAQKWIPPHLVSRYENAVRKICEIAEPYFEKFPTIRLHGDCHLQNLLWDQSRAFFLDFDDMIRGPAVQDLWLLVGEEGAAGRQQLNVILEGYEEMRSFDRESLPLIEILRSLRFVHYTAWLARRWEDPVFPTSFPMFNTAQYWEEKTRDLEEQLSKIS